MRSRSQAGRILARREDTGEAGPRRPGVEARRRRRQAGPRPPASIYLPYNRSVSFHIVKCLRKHIRHTTKQMYIAYLNYLSDYLIICGYAILAELAFISYN